MNSCMVFLAGLNKAGYLGVLSPLDGPHKLLRLLMTPRPHRYYFCNRQAIGS